MELKELTSAFAAKLGINGLAAEDGVCALEIDGIPLQIAEMAAGGALLATAVVGPPPPERLEKFYQALLDAGHNFAGAGGGVLTRNPGDGHIWLQSRESLSSLDVEAALAKIKSLGDAAVNWRDIIREYREGAPIPEPETATTYEAPDGGGNVGLMMV